MKILLQEEDNPLQIVISRDLSSTPAVSSQATVCESMFLLLFGRANRLTWPMAATPKRNATPKRGDRNMKPLRLVE